MAVKPPPCVWAQRKDRVFVTVELMECKCEVGFGEQKITFSGKGKKGGEEGEYKVEFDLLEKIVPEECAFRVTDRCVEIVGKKKEVGPYWDKLVQQPSKVTKSWLGTNWALYCEEEDEDEAANAKAEGFGGYGNKANLITEADEDSADEGVDDRPADISDITG
eukprot:TRINITY_DN48150_c0_g1_i1.p1 TRINITY_DN48150_c0_g1~~TRINITY_DN48150_c0_g1_i1.p1  ORF type:complete len:180 (+),score=79.93 TRINITY_DN48150_c0_g1_i1:52-540(+)